MDESIAALLWVAVAVLALTLLRPGRRAAFGIVAMPHSRAWTSSLSTTQAGVALGTVGQRLGYSVDRDQRPGFTVLADGERAANYGQVFPVSLTGGSGGTVVRVGISAKDPALALTDAVQERRLESLVRIMRTVFVAAEEDALRVTPL